MRTLVKGAAVKALLVVSGMMMMIAACGTADVDEHLDEDPVLQEAESAICGTTCGEGSYVADHTCNKNCGDCTPGVTYNSVTCYPIPVDGYFYTCGINSCPVGTFASDYSMDSDCPSPTNRNSTACRSFVNSSSASVCGIGTCPSGMVVIRYSYSDYSNAGCNTINNGPAERNQTACVRPNTTPFYACGSSCPGGFTAQGFSYHDNCRPSNSAPTNVNNQVYCVPTGS
jgi:ribosomal protein S27AE